jgi:hypothetical protein
VVMDECVSEGKYEGLNQTFFFRIVSYISKRLGGISMVNVARLIRLPPFLSSLRTLAHEQVTSTLKRHPP